MKKRYILLILFWGTLSMYSFIAYSDNWIELPAVIKLKYDPKDLRAIGKIDIAITKNDSNSILLYGKISDPVKLNYDFYSIHIDSITIEGENFYQKLDLDEGISEITIFKKIDKWQNEYSVKIVDINKDGYSDIAVYSNIMSGNKNHTFCYYLYNPELRLFRINYSFSLPNLIWDETNKTYTSFGQGGHASLIYTQNTYKIRNDSLITVETVSQDYNQKLDKYIRITKTALKTEIDTLTIKN